MNCPNCNNNLFQHIELGILSETLEFKIDPQQTIYICAKCGYQISNRSDFNPLKLDIHITGKSMANQQRILTKYSLNTPENINNLYRNGNLITNQVIFVTKDYWEKKRNELPIQTGTILNIIEN